MREFKFAARLVAVSIAVLLLSVAVLGAELTDIAGHWSEQYVEYGVENGYISGYPDGTFLPDKAVTRAEFSKMVNSALGITRKLEISFPDVEETDWFYGEVGKALYAGYVSGYEDGSFRAFNNITRQEAAVILSRIATRPEETLSIEGFADSKDTSDWAKTAMDFAYSKGFFTGDDLGNLNPKATLTRAQAAKILNKLCTEENVVTGDYTVNLGSGVCSETIFTDDVYFSSDSKEPSLLLDGCTVLGDVYLRTTKPSKVTVEDSALNGMIVDMAHADVTLKDGSAVKEIILESPAAISGDGAGNIILRGNSLSSETTEILASSDSVSVYSDAVIKAGEIEKLNVKGCASIILQNGKVEDMEVDKGAAGSVVTLSEGVTVENLTVSGNCSFMGKGKITNAYNRVAGVTYATLPENITGVSSESSDSSDEPDYEDEGSYAPTARSPRKEETDVAVDKIISINFATAILDSNGDPATARYVEQNVQLRKRTSGGSLVSFEAELTSSRRIEIEPIDYLDGDTRYYIVIPAGTFMDSKGNTNNKISYYFTTVDDDDYVSGSISFSPSDNKTNVDISEKITITFPSAIRRQNGSAVTSGYLANTAIELREKNTSGSYVDISASINYNNTIVTITPDSPLKPGTTYCVIVKSGTLEYSADGSNIYQQYSYFTTADKIGITATPKSGATGVALDTEIVIEFNCEIFADDGTKIEDSDIEDIVSLKSGYYASSGKAVDFTAEIADDRKSITIKPVTDLTSGTTYHVVIPAGVITNKNETENDYFTSSFTAISKMQPAISPADGKENVSEEKIVISFNEPVYKDRYENAIDDEYIGKLIEDGYITLCRKDYSNNLLKNPKSIEISEDLKTITIVGGSTLVSGRTYVVTVSSGKFWNESGYNQNLSATSTFSTYISGSPEINLTKESDGFADVSTAIVITFDDVMKTGSGALNSTHVQNKVVTLYKDSEDGEDIGFYASVSTDGKTTITITPRTKLQGNTTYYVVIHGQTMLNSRDEYNGGYSYSFVTDETVVKGCKITPENRTSNVPVNTDITIEFNSALYRKGGKTGGKANTEYLVSNKVISLKDGNSSYAKDVEFELSLDDDKIITVTPIDPLDLDHTYYLYVASGDLYYFDGTLVDSASAYFTTVKVIPSIETPVVSEVTDKDAVVTVNVAQEGTLKLTYVTDGEETVIVDGAIVENGDKKEYKLNKLESETKYTVKAVFVDNNGKKTEKTVTFTTEESRFIELEITKLEIDVDGDGKANYRKTSPGEEESFTIAESTDSIRLTAGTSKDADVTIKCVVVTEGEDSEEEENTVEVSKSGVIAVESGKSYVITVTAECENEEEDAAFEEVNCKISISIN